MSDRVSDSDFRAGVYRHFKGRMYLALGLARDDETDEVMVVYVRLYERNGYPMSVRRLAVWNEQVEVDGVPVPRFTFVGSSE
ncbi:MAG: DUF1653 domain-containing protein [Pseudomonadota bacterium]|nr:DUF1653 domain-containing protein [Pseudomonadota bacterium]